ncbi:MAG: hypothetical protein OXH75_12040 [Acidobacteria bacterium]|nr:hypothetical protein [Acidobacteriota bacterium]
MTRASPAGRPSPAEAMAVHDELFPDEPLDRAKRQLIERVFGNL